MPALSPPAPSTASQDLEGLIRADQFAAIRRCLAIAVPVNVLLSLAIFAVAFHNGRAAAGGAWLAASLVANAARFLHVHLASGIRRVPDTARAMAQMRWAAFFAVLSGLVWSMPPLLALSPSGPDSVFYLIVSAGISGGAIALGYAYAPIAISFVAPILLGNVAAMLSVGTLEQICLALTVAVYLLALTRSAVQSEAAFRATTQLKHEAKGHARSLSDAHAATLSVANEMFYRAQHDPLTDILNRSGFLAALDRHTGGDQSTACLMLLDLDGFKSINDTFGHKAGDLALIEVSRRIVAALPFGASVARFGGDEFAILLCPSVPEPLAVAEILVASISRPIEDLHTGRIGASIGIYLGDLGCGTDALVCADEALYEAKSAGRNSVRIFDEALRSRLDMRRDSERDLLGAIENGTIEVWFQPIFGEAGRRLAGLEALLRWRHPKHGWIAPNDVISAAAMAGLSERLFVHIVERACRMAGSLAARGFADMRVAINVSPREMSGFAVDRILLEQIGLAGLAPQMLEVEITEDTALDVAAVEGKLAALAEAGLHIVVDDFGVGYSSLSTLQRLRAHRIKIDRCFVTGIGAGSGNRTLLQAMLSLGRALGMEVVAEGVETAEDVLALSALGFQVMQGHHLGRPVPPDVLLSSLDRASEETTEPSAYHMSKAMRASSDIRL